MPLFILLGMWMRRERYFLKIAGTGKVWTGLGNSILPRLLTNDPLVSMKLGMMFRDGTTYPYLILGTSMAFRRTDP